MVGNISVAGPLTLLSSSCFRIKCRHPSSRELKSGNGPSEAKRMRRNATACRPLQVSSTGRLTMTQMPFPTLAPRRWAIRMTILISGSTPVGTVAQCVLLTFNNARNDEYLLILLTFNNHCTIFYLQLHVDCILNKMHFAIYFFELQFGLSNEIVVGICSFSVTDRTILLTRYEWSAAQLIAQWSNIYHILVQVHVRNKWSNQSHKWGEVIKYSFCNINLTRYSLNIWVTYSRRSIADRWSSNGYH